jgi:hypothetical protein
MKNIYGIDRKLNLEEIFTNEEIKLLKKTLPKINILIRSSPNNSNSNSNISKQNTSKSELNKTENSKDKIFVYKKYFYKLILENIKNKYEQEGNKIMIKTLSFIIEDLFNEGSNINECNSKSIILNNNHNDNKQKTEKIIFNKMKQMSTLSLPEKKINEINNEIISGNISNEKSNKIIEKDEKMNLKNNLENIKKIKSPNNNYKNIYYYNIINSKKIINNNNFKKDYNKNRQNLINKKFVIKNEKPLYYIDYSINYHHNNMNKINPTNLSFFNHKNTQSSNLNNYSSSTIQIYNRTEQNKNNKVSLNKRAINQSMINGLIENYNNSNAINNEKKKKESYKKYSSKNLSKKIKSVKFLVKHISTKKNAGHNNKTKTPIEIRKVNICTDINIDNLFNFKRYAYMNVDANLFNNIENQDFNIFNLNKSVGRENILPVIGNYIFNRFGFYNILKYNKFENWSKKIADGYIRTNPYHTDLHAADITHTCLIYLKVGKINKICKFSKNSKCALFLSCMCHDYKHPGVNNNYLKETRNKIAIKYNDISILENMHIAQTFKLINNQNNEYNIFQDLDNNTYKQFRKEMISCVLATDMTFHNDYLEFLKKNTKKSENSSNINEEKKNSNEYQNYMNVLIHSADISNPTKPFDIYFLWAELVVKEFYDQGDKEKKLNLPCSCDRNKVSIYQSQLGFINFIEIPYFSVFVNVFENLKFYMDNLNSNKQRLIKMQEKDKEKDKKVVNK